VAHIRKHLSYANVMSSIAVFLILGGATAFAALGRNTVGTRQLKRNAVTAAKIKRNAVTAAKIRRDAVTGAKVKESTLGQVPSAAQADNADTVGGLHVVNFHLNGTAPLADQQILDLSGLQLRASCTAGTVTVTAHTTVNDGEISAWSDDASSGLNAKAYDDTFNVGDSFELPEATDSDTLSSGAYTGGDLRTVRFFYNEEDSVGSNDCLLNGYAIG
jgi:hypothetical protein